QGARVQDSARRPDAVTAVEEAVRAARLDMVFGGQPMALAVSVVLGAIIVAVMRSAATALHLYLWFGALAAVSAVRGLLYKRYRLQRSRRTADLNVWERRFYLGCLIAGVTWGSSAFLVFPVSFILQGFLAFVLAGVSSGAMAELSVAPRLARAFIIPCVV